jgi:asparagine synthase (glutamine-hydrolysing)
MCALAGYALAEERETSSARVRAALLAMRHRGPDDEGVALFDPAAGTVAEGAPHAVAFGHRRFAIIDTSPAGHQPFWSADGTVCAALNGEVYNYVEVRAELAAQGVAFRTSSDTEVLVAAYQRWGADCFPRLNGFWAVSLWDGRRRQVLLARDRLGKAPLYVWRESSGLFWASELKGLFALAPRAGARVDARTVAEFVTHNRRDVHGSTCYEGVTSFPAGAHAWVEPGGSCRPTTYWALPAERRRAAEVPSREAAARVEELLRDAVRIRLRADVPVGVQLSGGLDSSSALALAAQEAPRVRAYTVAFDEPEADEERFARLAAAHYPAAVDYRVIKPPAGDLLEALDDYVYLMGEPFHSPNQFASQRVWQAMHADGLRVVLYGAGGDEVFAGYADEYYLPYLRHLLRRGAVGAWLRGSLLSTERTLGRQLRDYGRRLRARLGGRRLPAEGDPFVPTAGAAPREGPAEDIEPLLRDNMTDWRMGYWLRLDNQNSMGVPVELRCPFLDHRLVEYAFTLPVEYLIRDGWLKWVLRRAMAPHLPAEVVWRRRKMGFPFPLSPWLRAGRERLLAAAAGGGCPFVDDSRLRARYDAMALGNPRRLWCLLSVALWWKRCVEGRPLAA